MIVGSWPCDRVAPWLIEAFPIEVLIAYILGSVGCEIRAISSRLPRGDRDCPCAPARPRPTRDQQCSVPESGRAIGSTGGVVDDVCAGPALDGCPKSSVNQIEPFAEQNTPTPMRVKPGARMFARCPSECIQALWSYPTSVVAPPAAMFSPT